MDPFLVMSWRALIVIFLSGPCALWSHRRRRRSKSKEDSKDDEQLSSKKAGVLLLLRSLFMSVNVCLIYYAVRHMPIGNAEYCTYVALYLKLKYVILIY